MRDFALVNLTGDIDLSGGDLNFVERNECITQLIGTRFRVNRGEWFLDLRVGAPLFGSNAIFGARRSDMDLIRAIATQIIEDCPGVTQLVSLDIDLDENRALRIEWQAKGEDGETIANVENLIFGDI